MKSPIHLQVCAGLGNRIRALISGICLAEDMGSKLILHWTLEQSCCCRFESIFDIKSIPSYVEVVDSSLPDAVECLGQDETNTLLEYAERVGIDIHIKSYGKFYTPTNERWLQHLREIKPSSKIETTLDILLGGIDMNDVIGIHIRRGDNRKSIEESPIEAYEKVLEDYKNKMYIIASDDVLVKARMYTILGQKSSIFLASYLDRTSERGMMEAALDFFGLTRCSKIIGSVYSSFSDIAAQYGNKELILARRTL